MADQNGTNTNNNVAGAGSAAGNNANSAYQQALRRQQEYARRQAAHAAQVAGGAQQAAQAQSVAPQQQAAQQQAAAQRAAQQRAAAQQAAQRTQQYAQAQQASQDYTQAQQAGQDYTQAQPAGQQSYAQAQPANYQPYAQAQPIDQEFAPAQMVSGANYGYAAAVSSNSKVPTFAKPKKKHIALRVILIILALLVVVALGVLAYATWYMNTLSSNMAMTANEQQELKEVLTPVENQQEPYYVLLIGSDNWETYGERSDALLLIRVDQSNHKVTMVSVPRDTPYELNGNKVKINQAFAEQGAAGAVSAVQSLTGVNISYYAEIEFAGLADYVDNIGGITVDVPYAIDYTVYTGDQDTVHIDAGTQTLNGTQVVALARMRTAYEGQNEDAVRQSNVRSIAVALMNSVLNAPVTEIPGLVQQLSNCVSTSMDMNTMVSLAMDFAGSGGMTLYTCTGPTAGAIDESTGLWLCYPNEEGWAKIMDAVKKGDDPSSIADEVNAGDAILQDVQ